MTEEPKKEDLKWEKRKHFGSAKYLKAIVGNLILLIEEEKKRTLEQIEKSKDLLERMKKNK